VNAFIAYTVFGFVTGGAYAIAASGLVLTYTTSRIFNVAHGAIGMVMAFVFWQLEVKSGLPTWLSVFLVICVIAPLFGALVERFAMRRLAGQDVSVSLVVTIGLMVLLIGVAQQVWPPAARTVPAFFPNSYVHLGSATITGDQILTIALAGLVAVLLYVLLSRARVGVAMRAVVDNTDLLALHGARPNRLSGLSWAIGSSLAALAGILLVTTIGLDYYELTLLVVSAYAAAVLGRLQNLTLTFVGAIVLGLAQSYVQGYVPLSGALNGLPPAIPVLFLFLIVVLLPQAQLRIGQIKGISSVPVPSARRTTGFGIAFVVGVGLISAVMLDDAQTFNFGIGLAYALIALSLVPLTGYGGYLSLAPFTFAGIGAVVVARIFPHGSPLGLVVGALAAAAVGAVVSLPLLRLRGLYLALGTIAFADLMDKLVFQASWAFGYGGSRPVDRIGLFGMQLNSDRDYLLLIAVVFALVAAGVLAIRRGPYGRLLIAMRDSPAACGTLGLDLTRTRVLLFTLSAGIAGLGGTLYAGLRTSTGPADFTLFSSLPLVLLAVVGGVTSISGVALGGMLWMLLPVLQSKSQSLGGLVFMLIGAGALLLGRNPNGLASYAFLAGRWFESLLRRGRPGPPALAEEETDEGFAFAHGEGVQLSGSS
jgi:branched-chain amino acid transport system permease protein